MLSEKDKERIREEAILREAIRAELAGATRATRRRRGLYEVINSPLFIAIAAGFALNLTSKLILNTKAQNEKRAAQDNALRMKKIEIVSTVANDLATYVSMKGSWQKRKIRLNKPDEQYPTTEGLSHADAYKEYSELWKSMMQLPRRPEGDLATIRSFFADRNVIALVADLDKTLESIGDATDEAGLISLIRKTEEVEQHLFTAMGEEIKRGADRED